VFDHLKEIVLSYPGWQWLHKNPVKTLSPVAIQQLDRITVPVLIITGEKDIDDFQEIANILHKSIKQSVKREIAGAGHMCNMEKPNAFNNLVYQFLQHQK
jgi:3-oxoadipate enol-lactonase